MDRDKFGRFVKGNVPWTKGKKGIHLSPKTEFKKGKTNWNKGLTKETDERIKKFSDKRKGFKHTIESRKKMSDSRKKLFIEGKLNIWCKNKKFVDYDYYSPKYQRIIRKKVLERDNFTCQECGKTNYLIVHHKKPLKESGTHELNNLITLCQSCHRKIHV